MWRSLFYSFGIGLFALGLQSLILDHVLVPKNTKIQKLIKKIFDDDSPAVAKVQAPQQPVNNTRNGSPNWARQAQAPNSSQSFGTNTGSRFGPSRFSGPAYGTGYGGPRVQSNPMANQRGFSGYQNQGRPNGQFVGYRSSSPTVTAAKTPVPMQKIQIREWMPWSLLASGAIIFLYTHTLYRRGFQD